MQKKQLTIPAGQKAAKKKIDETTDDEARGSQQGKEAKQLYDVRERVVDRRGPGSETGDE